MVRKVYIASQALIPCVHGAFPERETSDDEIGRFLASSVFEGILIASPV